MTDGAQTQTPLSPMPSPGSYSRELVNPFPFCWTRGLPIPSCLPTRILLVPHQLQLWELMVLPPLQRPPHPLCACSLDGFPFSHSFLIIPSCPVPLQGRDILHKLQATICLSPSPSTSAHLVLPLLPCDSSSIPNSHPSVDPQVWDISRPIVATHWRGLKPIIDRLRQQGLLIPINSLSN